MSQLNYGFLFTVEAVLRVKSVSGRESNYAPKMWAFVDLDDHKSENSIKVRATKRVADEVKALGNGARVRVDLKLETANEEREFGENGDKTQYWETVTRYTVTEIVEVIEPGTMPEKKKDEDKDRISA